MWYVDEMIELGELTLLSPYVEQDTDDKVMVNLGFVGASGKGKSRIIKVFSNFPKFKLVTNTSYDQIVSKIIPEIERGDVITLGYPEFNKLLQRKESTMASTIAIQNSMIEEGIDCIEMPNANIKFVPALKANHMLAITTDVFDKFFPNFWEIGWAQRHIWETWRYTQSQIDEACEKICRSEDMQQQMINHDAKMTRVDIDPVIVRALVPIAKRMTSSLMNMAKQIYEGRGIPAYHRKDDEVIPFRYLKQLRLLCQTSALERELMLHPVQQKTHLIADADDYARIFRLSKHMNFDFNVVQQNAQRGIQQDAQGA